MRVRIGQDRGAVFIEGVDGRYRQRVAGKLAEGNLYPVHPNNIPASAHDIARFLLLQAEPDAAEVAFIEAVFAAATKEDATLKRAFEVIFSLVFLSVKLLSGFQTHCCTVKTAMFFMTMFLFEV